MPAKNILLFGATGQIGSFILEAVLTARNSFGRVAIFTSARTAEAKSAYLEKLKQQKVDIIIGDVEDESAVKAAYNGIIHSTIVYITYYTPPALSIASQWLIGPPRN